MFAVWLLGCETSVYYPQPLGAPDGWEPACGGDVDARVIVENAGDTPVDVHELNPFAACAPVLRGTVPPGESAELGRTDARIWRVYDADSREHLGTFELVDGENVLEVP